MDPFFLLCHKLATDAEIYDVEAAVLVEHDVLGFEIPVHYSPFVDLLKNPDELAAHFADVCRRNLDILG